MIFGINNNKEMRKRIKGWASDVFGLHIRYDAPAKPMATYPGQGMVIHDPKGMALHEIGHYVVADPARRATENYGLHRYKERQLYTIFERKLSNQHTIEDVRASAFGFYAAIELGDRHEEQLNASLLRAWSAKTGVKEAIDWLWKTGLIYGNGKITGLISNEKHELDDPMAILEIK
jgi:hypothetical protein